MFDDGLDLAKMTDVFNRKANYFVGYILPISTPIHDWIRRKTLQFVCLKNKTASGRNN